MDIWQQVSKGPEIHSPFLLQKPVADKEEESVKALRSSNTLAARKRAKRERRCRHALFISELSPLDSARGENSGKNGGRARSLADDQQKGRRTEGARVGRDFFLAPHDRSQFSQSKKNGTEYPRAQSGNRQIKAKTQKDSRQRAGGAFMSCKERPMKAVDDPETGNVSQKRTNKLLDGHERQPALGGDKGVVTS